MDKTREIVSIIIPVFNAEKYIEETIESIVAQTYCYFEALFIDDGSTDRSNEIIKKYCKIDSRIKMFIQENKGVSSARNIGLCNAKGKFICFVDADDYIEKQTLQVLVDAINYDNADVVFYNYIFENAKSGVNSGYPQKIIFEKMDFFYQYLKGDMVLGSMCQGFYRKDKISSVRFNSEYFLGEDQLFMVKCIDKLDKIVYIPNALYHYRFNSNSISKMNQTFEHQKSDILSSKDILEIVSKYGRKIEEIARFRLFNVLLTKMCQNIYLKNYKNNEKIVEHFPLENYIVLKYILRSPKCLVRIIISSLPNYFGAGVMKMIKSLKK